MYILVHYIQQTMVGETSKLKALGLIPPSPKIENKIKALSTEDECDKKEEKEPKKEANVPVKK